MTKTTAVLQTSTDHVHIRPGEDTVMHVLASLRAPSHVESIRAPITAMLVLDVSGSMRGEPLAQVKRAASNLLGSLGPMDRAGVVTFSSGARLVSEVRSYGVIGRTRLRRDINRLKTEGMTNIAAGLELAKQCLPPRRPRERQILLVLSDGRPNEGPASPSALGRMVHDMRPDVAVSTLGFGHDHDEKILGAMAEGGSGRYYFISDPNLCYAQFAAALGAQADVVVEDVRLGVLPSKNVEVLGILGASDLLRDTPTGSIELPDLLADTTYDIALKLRVRAPVGPDPQPLVSLTLGYRRVGQDDYTEETCSSEVEVREGPPSMSSVATRKVLVLRCEQERRDARSLAEDGDAVGAAQLLRDAAAIIEQVPRFAMTDGSPLAEAYDQLIDDADFYEQTPDLEAVRAFRRGQGFGVGGNVNAGAYQAAQERSRAILEGAAGDLPRALLYVASTESTFPLLKPRIILGRSRTCDVTVFSSKVSRQSAAITAVGGRFWLEDLGSANGVYIDGAKIQQHPLRSGDAFTIGDHDFVYLEH